MSAYEEVQAKLERVRALLRERRIGALWLRSASSVAWITGGVDVAVNTADSVGVASVVITEREAALWTNTIEAPRLRAEDAVEERGFTLRVTPWHEPQGVELGATLATDIPLAGAQHWARELAILRARLLPAEVARFRTLARDAAEAMRQAVERVRPGQTEHVIAAALAEETLRRGMRPIVTLVAVDERVHRVRHPLPTERVMRRYAMLVLCARRGGLTVSLTRLVHFGPLPDELQRKQHACAHVDAAVIAASRPARTLDALFDVLRTAYARVGYADEWRLHHQGGVAGYEPRELLAVPGERFALEADMVCAWNPSISGVKSEDTILVRENGAPEVLTATPDWPTVPVEVDGVAYPRPLILVRG